MEICISFYLCMFNIKKSQSERRSHFFLFDVVTIVIGVSEHIAVRFLDNLVLNFKVDDVVRFRSRVRDDK